MQFSFERYEKKYLLTRDQYLALRGRLSSHMQTDQYGVHTISSVYYDTPDRYLIRRSLEHPRFKEKFRLRAYGDWEPGQKFFAEIKKKLNGVVYKRRVFCSEEEFAGLLSGQLMATESTQIQREILYLFSRFPLSPSALIKYEREALFSTEEKELRITFDSNVRGSDMDHISFSSENEKNILSCFPGKEYLMEIKFPSSAPLWLCRILSEEKILPRSFSKYGVFYTDSLRSARFQAQHTKYHQESR